MKLSKIFSYLFHPILIPTIVLYIGINNVDYFYLIFQNHSMNLYLTIISFTIVLPLISAILFVKYGQIESLEMRDKTERRGPLLTTAAIMIIGFPIFNSTSKISLHLSSIYISSIILLIIAFFITKKWKISLHMLGVGGATGTFISLNYLFGGLYYFSILFIFLSGFLAFSRLELKAHNEKQVYIGFILGCFFQSFFILSYSSIISTISILRSSIAPIL